MTTSDFRVGERVTYDHAGVKLPAEVTQITEKGGIQLRIDGWLGKQFIQDTYRIQRVR